MMTITQELRLSNSVAGRLKIKNDHETMSYFNDMDTEVEYDFDFTIVGIDYDHPIIHVVCAFDDRIHFTGDDEDIYTDAFKFNIYAYLLKRYIFTESSEIEFTSEQLERMDEVENATSEYVKVMTEQYDMDWDMSVIGELADMTAEYLTKKGYKVRYPVRVEDCDGTITIKEYWEE